MSSNTPWICPSILSADFARLGEDVKKVVEAGADRIHVDVMDNHYVPNLTFGPLVCKALKNYGIKTPLDVHLMVEPVDQLIKDFAEAGATCIVFHPEASKHIDRSLQLIKSLGCEAGLALNPATPVNSLDHVMDYLDRILIMSVNPGFGGQAFIPEALTKAKLIKYKINQYSPHKNIRLEIDGGVKINNIKQISESGIDTFVAGSAIFNHPASEYQTIISQMREQLNN